MNLGLPLASVACALAALAVTEPAVGPPRGPALVVRVVEHPSPPSPPSSAEEDRAMALAMESIDPAERARLLDQIRYTTARLEARLSPLGSDFDEEDGDPVEALRRAVAARLPTLTAARAMVRDEASIANVEARVVANCRDAVLRAGERCEPLWSDAFAEEPSTAQKGRLALWAASHVAVADFGSAQAAAAAARALRERVSDSRSPLALVLTAHDLAQPSVPEHAELREATRLLGRAMQANRREDSLHVDALARPAPSARAVPWLSLAPGEVAVVPRLSALYRTAQLREEVRTAAGGANVRWTRAPL